MFIDNNWYGHRYILSKYCRVNDRPCFSSIQHGWYKEISSVILKPSKIKYAPFLCWNERTLAMAKESKIYNSKIIGSPFLYVDKIIQNTNKNAVSGTLFFPAHSVPATDNYAKKLKDNFNQLTLIEKIEKISEPPYVACLYYSDYNKENISMFEERNWRVISLGDRSNKNRLIQLYHELSKVKNSISTEIGTSTFYSLYLKKRVKVIYDEKNNFINPLYNKEFFFGKKLFYKKYPELFDSFLTGEKGFELAKEELGFKYLKSTSELKKLLGWNSFTKVQISKIIYHLMNLRYGKQKRN